MTSDTSGNDVVAEYSARLASHQLKQAAYERQHKQLGFLKLAPAALIVIVFVLVLKSSIASVLWLLLPLAALAFLEKIHAQVLVATRRCKRIISFYGRGLARLGNRWMGTGESGADFLDSSHPYARDLDLFGKGSLYECCALPEPLRAKTCWRSGCLRRHPSRKSKAGSKPFWNSLPALISVKKLPSPAKTSAQALAPKRCSLGPKRLRY